MLTIPIKQVLSINDLSGRMTKQVKWWQALDK